MSGVERRGRLVRLPVRGRAVIVSDLHGHIGDFLAVLARSRLVERWEAGEEVYLLLTGDVPDTARHQHFDGEVPADGDCLILERLMALDAAYPGRIFYLEGNHDFHLDRLAGEVEAFAEREGLGGELRSGGVFGGEVLSRFAMDYAGRFGEGLYYNNVSPYDMLGRMTAAMRGYITGGPILAVLPGAGVIVTHAGPMRSKVGGAGVVEAVVELRREDVREMEPERYFASPFHQLLNHRYPNGDYDLEDLEAFCGAFEARVLVTGHTPLSYLVGCTREGARVERAIGAIGDRQVVLCSSFGALSRGEKAYLEVDLGRPLSGLGDLRDGEDIVRVYEGA